MNGAIDTNISGVHICSMNPIAEYRTRTGLSQSALADLLLKAGYQATQGLVSKYETGEIDMSIEKAVEFETATDGGIRLESLVSGVNPIRDRAGRLVGYTVTVGDAPQDEAA